MEYLAMLLFAWLTHREKRQEPVSEQAEEGWAGKVKFDPGDPTDWNTYIGQDHVKEVLQLILDTVHVNTHAKALFVAAKGVGKTAIARIFAHKYLEDRHAASEGKYRGVFGRYIEVTPAMLKSKDDLDRLMRNLRLWDVLLIDEVHMLSRELADTLLPALEDNVYPFPEGMRELPEDFMWLAATTDVGLLPEAFQDRFQVVALDPLSVEDLKHIVQLQPLPTENDAAYEIARRSAGYPREVKRVYSRARDVAIRDSAPIVTLTHAAEAFRLLDLDTHGLYANERRVLEALFRNPKYYAPRRDGSVLRRFAQSERTIRTLTGLDEQYYTQIESKLLRLGYLTISSAGRELTDRALETYFERAA